MNPPLRLETIEIELASGAIVPIPAATAEQAAAFVPPSGLRWVPLDLVASSAGEVRSVLVLAHA